MSKFALISLISDQPMPNVMAVLQREQSEQAEQRFTHLEFIVSADKNDLSKYDRRFDEICKRLETFFENRGYIVSRRPPVDPYNIKAALKACQQAIDALKEKGYVMLTVNAQLAIIECKSDATLSEQFGKIRALQRDRGRLYGRSFFIRSGERQEVVHKFAEFYGIDKVIDAGDLPRLSEIVAQNMGIQPANRTVTERA